ncbi:glycosyltransferase family 2 protein [Flavobacterium hiemivividum]|uniref:Glycosyltransferase family 2 protein n=1 Tax=Flavobacterium hiemivividum TaxID=2541734 RepID=A0A4R5CVV2_9FLAO|nr:glycosyltransferase family A protein [Flavobacterium hiemivividum]TDE04586.1 glycosyltransferase family 2 protein [Flavobacterium hiemivividum]
MKKLAVLLPAYNAASYIKESINSVLNQTFVDFDLYVYDDCSTDETAKIIKSYQDLRVFYIQNGTNIGVTKTLNKGLDFLLPKYEFIARMDADDWCFAKRFEKQLEVLEKQPEIILCGTQGYWLKDLKIQPNEGWTYPTDPKYIKYYLLFGATFGHSSVIMRSQTMIANNLRYDETKINCQDWELWVRMLRVGKLVNLPDFLMKYRILENSNHRATEKQKIHYQNRSKIIANYWGDFGVVFSEKEINDFYYSTQKVLDSEFKIKLEQFIDAFNSVFLISKSELSREDQKNFSYLLARKLLSYWKRSGVSRKNLSIWFLMVRKVQFMNKAWLLKSLIR